jgi:mannosyltransferase OCH1-like enzyme
MIPRKIHYIWLGSKISSEVELCITSWKKYLINYEFILWDETNIPQEIYFVNYMISKKKWAFASDYLRFHILYHYGGIYLDTDMVLFKSLDSFLDHDCFLGLESSSYVSGGIIGSIPFHPYMKYCLDQYSIFNTETGCDKFLDQIVIIPKILTSYFKNVIVLTENYVEMNDVAIYKQSYFYPIPFDERDNVRHFKPEKDSFALHLWNASWHDEFQNFANKRYLKSLKMVFLKLSKNNYEMKEIFCYFKYVFKQIYKNIKYSILK